jgi:hypothetical protein
MKNSLDFVQIYEKVFSISNHQNHFPCSIDNDEAIEALHAIVKRQKDIGHAMNSEVDRHNEIIDTITDRTGLLDARVKRQTIFIKTIERKSSAAMIWCIIILLFIAIIVIVAVPYKK